MQIVVSLMLITIFAHHASSSLHVNSTNPPRDSETLATAEGDYKRALGMHRELAARKHSPNAVELSKALEDLVKELHRNAEDLAYAEATYKEALSIYEKFDPTNEPSARGYAKMAA